MPLSRPSIRPLAGLRLAFPTRHHPYFGNSGSTTYISTLLRGLADAGATIRVIVVEPPGEISKRLWRDKNPYGPGISTRIRYRRAIANIHFLPWSFRSTWKRIWQLVRPGMPQGSVLP